jgi:hypothetical protein
MIELLLLLARGGGGGSSGGSSGGSGIIVIPIIIIGVIVSWYRRKKRIAAAKHLQKTAQQKDASWSDEIIQKRASEVFATFQQDWSNLDSTRMKAYMTPRYRVHMQLMLQALQKMHRRNDMQQVVLGSATLFGVEDSPVDELDRFNVEIKAQAQDRLLDETTGAVLHSSDKPFEEVWHFERENKAWMLDAITQVSRDGWLVNYTPKIDSRYHDFATRNHFYYNADFGWLLLPLHGILFGGASFGYSDVNHHVIGEYHKVLVQFFEYVPYIKGKVSLKDQLRYFYKSRVSSVPYTVAHATLPKDYSNIIVRRRTPLSFFSFTPRGMTKVKLEWQQFNSTFDVFASDIDKVNSLELLHPAFMESLANIPTKAKVNIEIVGSDLYFFTTDSTADYQLMLDLLKEAFDEMKM